MFCNFLSLPVLVFLPLVLAIFIMMPLCPKNDIFIRRFTKGGVIFHLIYSLLFWACYDKGFESLFSPYWIKSLGIRFGFAMDELSLVMTLLTTVVFSLAVIASKSQNRHNLKWYYVLILFFETAILGIFNAADIFSFFLFWELELIPAYFLIAHWGEGNSAKKSAIKFVLYTFVGSMFMLLGLLLLHYFNFLATGSMNGEIAAYDLTKVGVTLQLLVSFLLLIGFCVKLPVIPIHIWLPDAHTDAPTPVSMILAGVLLKTGAYAIIRFNFELLPEAFGFIAPLLAVIALVSIIYTAMVAYAQTDIKRIVAYSSISNMGLILLGICSLNAIGISGAIFHCVAHGLITCGLFMVCGIVYLRCKTRDINFLGGIAKSMPRFFAFATLIVLASIGVPLFAGFVGEVVTIIGAMSSEMSEIMKFVALFALPMLILSSCYMLKFLHRSFFAEEQECKPAFDITNHEFVVLAVTVVLLLLFGCYPASLMKIFETASVIGGSLPW